MCAIEITSRAATSFISYVFNLDFCFVLSWVGMYRLSENIPTPCCDLNTLSSAPTRYFWTVPSISEVEMDHVGKQFQKFTSLLLSSADSTTATFSSFRPDLQIVRNYRNVCTHSSFLVVIDSCHVDVCFFFSCVGMYRLSGNIRTKCCDLSTLSSAPFRCFWTVSAISEGDIPYVGKLFH